MEFFKNLTIRKKIFSVAVFISLVACSIYIFSMIESGILESRFVSNQIGLKVEEAKKLEGRFVIHKNLADSEQHKKIHSEIDSLGNILSDDSSENVNQLLSHYHVYDSLFGLYVDAAISRGLIETEGSEGALRAAVHDIEVALNEINNDKLSVTMLMCRRAEKDFIMRGKQKYVDRIDKYVSELKDGINTLTIEQDNKDNLLVFADVYKEKFGELVNHTNKMNEYLAKMVDEASKIKPLIDQILDEHESEANFYSTLQVVFSILSIIIGLFISYKISTFIADPIEYLERKTCEIAANPEDENFIDIDSDDEIGKLAHSINSMIDQIKDANISMKMEEERLRAELEQELEIKTKQIEADHKILEEKVNETLEAMDSFSRGSLNIQLDETMVKGNIKRLYSGFNNAVLNVRSMIVEIMDLVDTTSAAATQISVSAEQLHGGTKKQVDQSLSITAAVEEMAQTINHNADNATKTSTVANSNGTVAKDGRSVVQLAAKKIQDIANTVNDSLNNIEKLGESANQISKIVNVIKDISSQTNLLALNAAIEAASAGEMGRGFSVVAEEVRKLAERTTTATGEITRMIDRIQTETESVIEKMKHGYNEVDEGLELANKADAALVRIVDSSTDVESLVKEIAVANTEQATASDDISKNIESISSLSREASNGIEQIAQACDGLHKQTERLQGTLQKFTL